MARILIVEDDRSLADTLATLLRSSRQDAHTIHDGRAALTEAARMAPDVVISDIGLPSIDGAAVGHALRIRYATGCGWSRSRWPMTNRAGRGCSEPGSMPS